MGKQGKTQKNTGKHRGKGENVEKQGKQQTTTTTNFIENWKITNYITFPPANSLKTNRGGGS